MPPADACPNCGQNEWLGNPHIHYLPRLKKRADGSYRVDTYNGVHVKVWRCNNCLYVATFWEPD